MSSPKRFLPHLLLIILIVIWSASFVVSKVAQRQLEPFALVAVRFWLAALCVVPFLRGDAAAQLRTALGPGLAAGTALGCGYLLQMKGLTETSASMSGLLAGLIVPLVALGGFVFLRARLGPLGIGGLLLAIAGMVAICWPRGDTGTGPQDSLRGILLQVGSSASYAAHVLLLSRFGRQMPAVAFTLLQLVLVAVAGTVATLSTGSFATATDGGIDWNGGLLSAIAYLGILATAIAIGVQGMVQPRIPPTHVALLFTLQPLFAAMFGWALQGDHLDGGQLIGGAMIVLGVIVTSRDR